MYRRVYRQEGGGLSDLGSEAFMRQYVNNYVQDYNRRNQGEVAAKVMPRPVPIVPQRPRATIQQIVKKGISNLIPLIQNNPMAKLGQQAINAPEIAQLESEYGPGYTGKPSDARHQAGANEISKNVSNLIDKGSLGLVPEKFRDFLGDIVPNLGGGIKELGSLIYNTAPNRFGVPSPMPPKEALDMAIEDIAANYKGSFGTDNTKTAREIYEDVYGINNPQDDYGGVQEAIQNQVQTTVSVTTPGYYDPTFKSNIVQYQEQPITREEFEQTLPEGYKPLNSTYDAYFDTPYDERVETRKGSYSGMPIILSPENANYFQTYFQGPDSQLHTRPEDRVNAFQPVATPVSMQNQQQGLPSLMKIVNEQRNPTPVNPNAPYGYVEYTPPFYGGMMIPPGGNKPYMVPADKDGNPVNPKGIFKATI
jgi:hypothetical protein